MLSGLNPAQREAVETVTGPVLILAGAGSGKTKTLTHRIAHLVSARLAQPENILAVTFTNKAADEMKHRVQRLLKLKSNKALNISTFHSLCVKILRRDIDKLGHNQNFTILDTDEQLTAIKQVVKALEIDPKRYAPQAILSHISSAKNELIEPAEYDRLSAGHWQALVARVYPLYQDRLQKNNSLDFDDLLLLTVKLLRTEPAVLKRYQSWFAYIMVDEYQDTNTAQYQLVKLLSDKHHNLFVVGDDWQSIYSWRGANYRNILEFTKDYPKARVIKLEENYRSTQNILDGAQAIVAANQHRSQKKLWTKAGAGEKITVQCVANERGEGEFIVREMRARLAQDPQLGLNDFVVLYRTNAQSRSLEETLLKRGMPYRIVGGVRFYDRREIKDILAYLKVVANPFDEISLGRIINVPTRGIGEKGWATILEYAQRNRSAASEVLADVPLGGKAKLALEQLSQVLTQARAWSKNISALFDWLLKETGYLNWLNDKTIEGETRIENVNELKSVIEKYDGLDTQLALATFLEEVSLIQDTDTYTTDGGAVTLMTLHSAKGLEFDYVFIAGVEENLLPHPRSAMDRDELEEERRLCYVGITRAKKKVYLLYTMQRMLYGGLNPSAPSRFIDDIPDELKEETLSGPINVEAIFRHLS